MPIPRRVRYFSGLPRLAVIALCCASRRGFGGEVTPSAWSRTHATEAVVVLVTSVLLVVVSAHVPVGSSGRALDITGYVLLVAAGFLMGLCKRLPRLATLGVTVVLCVFVARRYPDGPVWLTGPVALAVLSGRSDRRTALVGGLGMFAALAITATSVDRAGAALWLVWVGWSAAAVFLGEAVRNRRSYLAGLGERARFAARSQEDEAARRVAEERLRIARDLHDTVAHAMATINVQAGAAAHVLARRPEAAGAALVEIQRASADVLDELGGMLAVLRDGAEQAERTPVPGIGDLGRLTDSVAVSGLAVDLSVDAAGPAVGPVLGTTVYRVVQESLTNVLRHSQARTVSVHLHSAPPGTVVVEVSDPGPACDGQPGGTGVGLRGMRERVSATGGRLEAGPRADGRFVVRASWGDR